MQITTHTLYTITLVIATLATTSFLVGVVLDMLKKDKIAQTFMNVTTLLLGSATLLLSVSIFSQLISK